MKEKCSSAGGKRVEMETRAKWSHWTTATRLLLGITGNYLKSNINQLGNLVQHEMEVGSY